MQSLFEIIEKKQEKNEAKKISRNIGERHEIIGLIFNKLELTSFKKIRIEWLGKILAKIKTPDLYAFHKECLEGKNYAAIFWHKLK